MRSILNANGNDYCKSRSLIVRTLKEADSIVGKVLRRNFQVMEKSFVYILIEKFAQQPVIPVHFPGKNLKIQILKRSRKLNQSHFSCLPPYFEEVVRNETCFNEILGENHQNYEHNKDLFEDDSEPVECACCFNNVVFGNMIQCADGHLFCRDCIKSYAKEAVFGSGNQSVLKCMDQECDCEFPQQMLEKVLDKRTLEKMEERQILENISKANVKNLYSCPFCDYKVIIPDNNKVLECDKCQRVFTF